MPIGLWDAAKTALAVKLWEQGYSAGHIARQLDNISRNAVIGKLHRMRVDSHGRNPIHTIRPKKAKHAARRNEMSTDEIEGVAVPLPEKDEPPVEYLAMENHQCRALLEERGSDGLLMCCGRTRLRNGFGCFASSYCAKHDREFMPGRYARGGFYGAFSQNDRRPD